MAEKKRKAVVGRGAAAPTPASPPAQAVTPAQQTQSTEYARWWPWAAALMAGAALSGLLFLAKEGGWKDSKGGRMTAVEADIKALAARQEACCAAKKRKGNSPPPAKKEPAADGGKESPEQGIKEALGASARIASMPMERHSTIPQHPDDRASEENGRNWTGMFNFGLGAGYARGNFSVSTKHAHEPQRPGPAPGHPIPPAKPPPVTPPDPCGGGGCGGGGGGPVPPSSPPGGGPMPPASGGGGPANPGSGPANPASQ